MPKCPYVVSAYVLCSRNAKSDTLRSISLCSLDLANNLCLTVVLAYVILALALQPQPGFNMSPFLSTSSGWVLQLTYVVAALAL